MYRCEWCEKEFEQPKWRMKGSRHILVCPHCGEEQIKEISNEYTQCVCCGKMAKSVDEFNVCDKCSDKLYEIWEDAVTKAMSITRDDYSSTGLFIKKYIKVFKEK